MILRQRNTSAGLIRLEGFSLILLLTVSMALTTGAQSASAAVCPASISSGSACGCDLPSGTTDLHVNLTCAGDAILAGNSNATLNLNGFTIIGSVRGANGVGGTMSNITIQGPGTIQDSAVQFGIFGSINAKDLTIQGVAFTNSSISLGMGPTRIIGDSISGGRINLLQATVKLKGNTINNSGLNVQHHSDVTITQNTFYGSGLISDASDLSIRCNAFYYINDDAIHIIVGSSFTIKDNQIDNNNGDGIFVYTSSGPGLIQDNTIWSNGGSGIDLKPSLGATKILDNDSHLNGVWDMSVSGIPSVTNPNSCWLNNTFGTISSGSLPSTGCP